MKDKKEWPCVVFARINVRNPEEVARFIWWLVEREWPDSAHSGRGELSVGDLIEDFWGWDAPRRRMAKLLWQLLRGSKSDREFYSRFTLDVALLKKDAERCAEILPPIQERLRWVLAGIEEVDRKTIATGQRNWGEVWFLSKPQADYVRQQLQKIYPSLLEKASDYQEAVQAFLNLFTAETIKAVKPTLDDPNRVYTGELSCDDPTESLQYKVWVEKEDGTERRPLLNAEQPYTYPPGRSFGWGYAGAGSKALAVSILADALNGDLELPRKHYRRFWEGIIMSLPQHRPFQLRRGEVIDWLRQQGESEEGLKSSQERAEERRAQYASRIERLEAVLKDKLYAQRFDMVPTDFEAALYLDLWQMLEGGRRIFRCNWCELPIAYDGSPRSNRQRARWEQGKPVYHQDCLREAARKRRQLYWKRISQNQAFKERRRIYARERRRLKPA